MITYFEFVGLNSTSSPEKIKKRKKALFSIYHPDKGGNVILTQLINEAFVMISKGCGNHKIEDFIKNTKHKILLEKNEELEEEINRREKERNKIKNINKKWCSEYNELKSIHKDLHTEHDDLKEINEKLRAKYNALKNGNKQPNIKKLTTLAFIVLVSCIIAFYMQKPVMKTSIKYVEHPIIKYVDRPVIEYVDKPAIEKINHPQTEKITKKKTQVKSLLNGDYDWKTGHYANKLPFIYTQTGFTRLFYDCSGDLQYRTKIRFNVKNNLPDFIADKESRDRNLNEYIYFLKNSKKHIQQLAKLVGDYKINNVNFSTNGAAKANKWLAKKCM